MQNTPSDAEIAYQNAQAKPIPQTYTGLQTNMVEQPHLDQPAHYLQPTDLTQQAYPAQQVYFVQQQPMPSGSGWQHNDRSFSTNR